MEKASRSIELTDAGNPQVWFGGRGNAVNDFVGWDKVAQRPTAHHDYLGSQVDLVGRRSLRELVPPYAFAPRNRDNREICNCSGKKSLTALREGELNSIRSSCPFFATGPAAQLHQIACI